MERTVEYLNATMSAVCFYAVELIRFAADGISAFETRTVLKPQLTSTGPERATTSEDRLLEQIENDTYREKLRDLLEVCRGLGLYIGRGKRGLTIRLMVSDRREPVTVAWLFPPGVPGWMCLLDLTLGYSDSAGETPSVVSALEDYVEKIATLPGVEPAKPDWHHGYHLTPGMTVRNYNQIADILAELVRRVSG